jgi:FtsP/CotA-like multicopper oxidase with cupredoxin domain
MSCDKSFGMKELSGTQLQSIEEQVGLLQTSTDDSRDSFEYQDDQEPRWKDQGEGARYHKPRRRWIRTFAIAFLLVCTLITLVHLVATHREHDQTVFTASARLRLEEDYILDDEWNFNAAPTTREYTWVIEDHELNPDGVYRPMILINSTFPGPLIECNEGDEIAVHVHNYASNATSIHWHGLYQNGTNYMDGTVGVTQCPIAPGHSFTYRFNVSGQTGTYWYHSHMSMQASDGLVGPLIIHARGDGGKKLQGVPYTQDRVVLLSDHYYDLSSTLSMQYLAPGNENDEPVPPSALINGRNVRNCSGLPSRNCSSVGISNALFDLSSTSNIRFRVINVGAFAEFSLQIDEHEFQVTEVDGTDVQPQSIHRLNINPAQRYSIILIPPKDDNRGLYWMRARMVTHCFAHEEPELQEEVWGVIHYSSPSKQPRASDKEMQAMIPQSKDWPEIIEVECRDLNTSMLEPVIPIPAPATVDHFISLRSSFQIRDWRLSRSYFNDSSFRINASQPILNTLLDSHGRYHGDPAGIDTGLFDFKHQFVYRTTGTPTIDILIQNFDDGTHPFHLHGYKFWVLAEGHGYPPPTPELHASLNLTNPLRRDTASVEAYGWMLIRFVADNPGVWAFHCHIGWHAEAGLMMVFATRMEDMEGAEQAREVGKLCGIEGRERGMGPNDDIWIGKPS